MMRVTNNMIVRRSKTNINANRAQVDRTNNQMATQKKIVKPSDNPIIAIRSLRLRSELSTITQYYENNIPDTESWMGVTETALKNMKDILTSAYEQTVYGATDSLNQDNRKTILKELQALQEQIYSEGDSDYAGRTVFTGYKTNQTLTFLNSAEAQKAEYQITERFNYKNIEHKKYYPNGFNDTSMEALFANKKDEDGNDLVDPDTQLPIIAGPDRYIEVDDINRVRLSYDDIEGNGTALTFVYKNGVGNVDVKLEYNEADESCSVNIHGIVFNADEDYEAMDGYTLQTDFDPVPANIDRQLLYKDSDLIEDENSPGDMVPKEGAKPVAVLDENGDGSFNVYSINDFVDGDITKGLKENADPTVVEPTEDEDGNFDHWKVTVGDNKPLDLKYEVTDTTALEKNDYALADDTIYFDKTAGELVFTNIVADTFNAQQTEFRFTYEKKGFETGELKPENYFDCVKHTDSRDINYKNYDENDNWKTEAIYYNIAGGQQMQINTEARDVFNSDIRRDMDDLISIVQTAINAQDTVDEIQKMIDSGMYDEDPEKLTALKDWMYEAETQLAYANQNMHDTYSSYITKFKGYLDTVNLAITDIGGRAERVSLTKNRMSIQQSTFKDLKSSNEDMELSELVINYSAASVAYQAALQAAAKIDQMSLLNYL